MTWFDLLGLFLVEHIPVGIQNAILFDGWTLHDILEVIFC